MTTTLNQQLFTHTQVGDAGLNGSTLGAAKPALIPSNDTFSTLLNKQAIASDAAGSVNIASDAPASADTAADTDTTATLHPQVVGFQYPGESSAELLNNTKNVSGNEAAEDRHKKAEEGASKLVANALILPILKQIRRSPWAQNNVFSGGKGEQTFGAEFDMQMADHIASSPHLGVKEALAARLEKKGQGAAATHAAATAKKGLDVHG